MPTYYFSVMIKNEVVQTYGIYGLTRKAAENTFILNQLTPLKELGELEFDQITKEEHITYQQQLIQNTVKYNDQLKKDQYVEKLNLALQKAINYDVTRLEEYLNERDLDEVRQRLLDGLLQAFKAITLQDLSDAKHYRHLQFILMDMHNDVEREKAVFPDREGQVKILANIINEIRSILTVAVENQEMFDCYELFILFNTFENYYEYIGE